MRACAARRQSVAQGGLETARRTQVEAGFAGFLGAGLRALAADLRGVVGLIVMGLPAGPDVA